jgi:uncharacterized protein YbjT (DUF2867 family)
MSISVYIDGNRRNIGPYLPPFRKAADLIEASGFDFTILRPAWLTDNDEVCYEITARNEPFNGTEVSRKSVATLVVECIHDPNASLTATLVWTNRPFSASTGASRWQKSSLPTYTNV